MTQETTKENYPRKNKNICHFLYKPIFYCRFECRFKQKNLININNFGGENEQK